MIIRRYSLLPISSWNSDSKRGVHDWMVKLYNNEHTVCDRKITCEADEAIVISLCFGGVQWTEPSYKTSFVAIFSHVVIW